MNEAMTPALDYNPPDDGYPNEAALAIIEKWDHKRGFRELMQQIRPIWQYAASGPWTSSPGKRKLCPDGFLFKKSMREGRVYIPAN